MADPKVTGFPHIEVQIDGFSMSGWANEDPPVEFPPIDALEAIFGKDGTLYGNDTGMRGGDVTLKFLPTSAGAQWWLQRWSERLKGKRRVFHGIYTDSELNVSISLRGGLLKTCPAAIVPGQTFEVTVTFQELIPNMDGANFPGRAVG